MRSLLLLLGIGFILLWSVNVFALPWFHDVRSGAATISEPASMLLLGTSLLGIASWGRKKLLREK